MSIILLCSTNIDPYTHTLVYFNIYLSYKSLVAHSRIGHLNLQIL
ncbi:unnamed protein product [Arabidopsis halleri]